MKLSLDIVEKMARKPKLGIAELDAGGFSLVSSDFQPYELVFQRHGKDGGGYDWEAVATELMRRRYPKILKKLEFDSEASLFCAIAKKRDHLAKLQAAIQDTFTSQKRLSAAIQAAHANEGSLGDEDEDFRFVVLIYFSEYLYEELDSLLEALGSSLPPKQFEVGSASGGGETKIYSHTNKFRQAYETCEPLLKELKLLRSARIGVRTCTETSYELLWPLNRKRRFKPKHER